MAALNKRTVRIATIYITFFLLYLPANPAKAIPSVEDINGLAETVTLITHTFMQKSFKLRMKYDYNAKFTTQHDKESLHKLAKKASDRLAAIEKKQKTLKKQIEDYEGDDWDAKYGSTGLWRKIFTDLYKTIFSKCEVDFYLALSSEQPQRNEILHKILAQIDSTFSHMPSDAVRLLKIKTLILLAETESDYKTQAKNALYSPSMTYPGMPCEFDIRRQIQKIKFTGKIKPAQLNKLTDYFFKIGCADDIELVLSLAFLQRQYTPKAFEKTVQTWPQTEDILGSLILSDISHHITKQQSLPQISVFEAELAAQAAWKNKAKDHQSLLTALAEVEKFQTPLILYVTAVAVSQSSQTQAVNLLIKASKLQQRQKSAKLKIPASKIAAQAAHLAYNLFIRDPAHCQLALKTFENYCKVAEQKIDEEFEYLHSIVLSNCGRTPESIELLQKIADRPTAKWRNRATLDLIIQAIQQNRYEKKQQKSKLLKQLSNLIADCTTQNKEQNKIRTEAITIYCRLLSESKDKVDAQKILVLLTDADTARDPNLNIFKSKALQHLGKLDASVRSLLKVSDTGRCEHTDQAMELLSQIIDKIDQFQKDDLSFMADCKKLAQFCYDCLNGQAKQRAGLFLIEISIFPPTKMAKQSSGLEKLLDKITKDGDANEPDLLRCRARLLTKQGKFDKATRLWAQLAKIRKSQASSENQRPWKWWRAKFYELYCWQKIPQTEKADILHTIDILENSFRDIPPLWAEKLNLLKQQCRSQLTDQSKPR